MQQKCKEGSCEKKVTVCDELMEWEGKVKKVAFKTVMVFQQN